MLPEQGNNAPKEAVTSLQHSKSDQDKNQLKREIIYPNPPDTNSPHVMALAIP